MKDNNDDNEFATTPLKASMIDVAATHAQTEGTGSADPAEAMSAAATSDADSDSSESVSASASISNGSADKIEEHMKVVTSKLEQKFNAKLDDLGHLIAKAGSKLQRLGEALCRIGDQIEHLPERRFSSKKVKPEAHNLH